MATTTAKKKVIPAKKAVARRPSTKKEDTVADVATKASLHPATPLIARVPDLSVVDRYISRDFNLTGRKTISDMEVFDYCYENGINLLIEGPTGPGKTMATRAWAASRNKIMARVPSNNGVEGSQLFGKYNPDKERGGFHWTDGPVTHVVRHGGVILINEVNFVPERVSTILFGLLDDNKEIVLLDHEGEAIRAHRGAGKCWCNLKPDTCDDLRVLIVADMNPDYAGTRELNAALRNRFGMQLTWDYDASVEKQLIASDSLRVMAGQIRDEGARGALETPVSTNMLMEFEKIAAELSVDFAVMNFVNHFRTEERDAVKLVCEAHSTNIADDYKPKDDTDDADVDDDADDDDSEDNTFEVDDDDAIDWLFAEDGN